MNTLLHTKSTSQNIEYRQDINYIIHVSLVTLDIGMSSNNIVVEYL